MTSAPYDKHRSRKQNEPCKFLANFAGSNWPIDVANTLLLRWPVVILRDDEVPKRCWQASQHVGSNHTVSQNDVVTLRSTIAPGWTTYQSHFW